MRARLPALMIASFALAACGGGGPPSPAGLAYGLPSPATVTYEMGDTSNVDIDAGGQMLQMRMSASGTFDVAFARGADGIDVTLSVQEYSARMTQPMGGPVSYDGDGIDSPVQFSLDRRGVVTMMDMPELRGQAKQFFTPLSTAQTFFPRLPGTAVGMGESWTDTIRYEGPEGEGEVSVIMVLTYTAAGDTVVDGQSLARFTFAGTSESEAAGAAEGVEFTQSVTGDMEGHVLWDMNAGVMVEHFTDSSGRGDMEVTMAPFPLGLRARQQRIIRRVEGM